MPTKKKKMDILVNFKVDKKALAQLDSFARKNGWSRSFIIREAIKRYIHSELMRTEWKEKNNSNE